MRFLGLLILLLISACKSSQELQDSRSSGSNVAVKGETGQTDSKMDALVQPYSNEMNGKMSEVIGQSADVLEVGVPQGKLGNWASDVVLDYAKAHFEFEVDFALLNNGGLRKSIPKGDITLANIYELMPFDNELVVLEIKGIYLDSLFSYMANLLISKYEERSVFPMSGIRMSIQKNRTYFAQLGEENMLPEKIYKVVTSDYLQGGGDNLSWLKRAEKVIQTGVQLRNVFIEAVKNAKTPIDSQIDGRLIMVY